jgi:hypothetical protein
MAWCSLKVQLYLTFPLLSKWKQLYLWDPEFHHNGHELLLLDSFLSYINPFPIFKTLILSTSICIATGNNFGCDVYLINYKQVQVEASLCLSKYWILKTYPCLIKHHAMKKVWWCGAIAMYILNLGIRWRWVVSFTSRPLYTWNPFYRRLGGPKFRCGRSDEVANNPPLPILEIEPRSSAPLLSHYTVWATSTLN